MSVLPTIAYLFGLVKRLLTDPQLFWALAGLVILGDVVLTQLIIRFIPYTEIDWETYMYQVELYMKGEDDYSKIIGPTGPLVYPAGHVHLHQFLHWLTGAGKNLPLAQQLYGALYIASLALSCAIYGKAGGAPNWIILLLPLSKRLHSIFALRLFNDCWAVVAAQLAILLYGRGADDIANLVFSVALSIKMSAFLYLPGILVVLFKRHGLLYTLRHLLAIGLVQAWLATPFLRHHPWPYIQNAFDLSRVFLYKWTVNWRFLDEQTFLSPRLAKGLLFGHVLTLIMFGLVKWCRRDGGTITVIKNGLRRPGQPGGTVPMSADNVTTILLTSNLIGILFARSLHYQFYSWYAHQIPFIAWRTKYPVAVKLVLLGAIEYAWNVFPSTNLSSGMLCAANAALVVGVWFGYPEGKVATHVDKQE
ncbi:mannosyltransferase [Stereum hirsutum FP-91666 SS1]|uniref:mannosyltransferase n=1 Tax=Stereum hirsutum (strain FP-91666) TaxID=721885 RepID=UPI000440F66E|nr:mannosyltransferase [Stereum hirsutum FP-91666 SS1]EIM89938.1 mannosyltransferase [Stereum hirsutum FP-91666 SS1]